MLLAAIVSVSPLTWLSIVMTINRQAAVDDSKNDPTSQVINEPSQWKLQ